METKKLDEYHITKEGRLIIIYLNGNTEVFDKIETELLRKALK